MKKDTDDLKQELMTEANFDNYLCRNQDVFVNSSPAELLADVFNSKSITKAELAKRAGMSETYLHKIFSGQRRPSRDKLLCLCLGLEASLDETQQLLKAVGYAPLYPAQRRDSVIIFGLFHGHSLAQINDKLLSLAEPSLDGSASI